MSIKSILRAVGARWQGFYPWTAAGPKRPLYGEIQQTDPVGRLKGRSDWLQANPVGCAACNWTGYADFAAVPCEVCEGRGLRRASDPLPIDPAPAVAPWDGPDRPAGKFGSTGLPLANARLIDPDFPNAPAWVRQAIEAHNGDVQAAHLRAPDPWPPHDDPYKAPPTCEPCDVVQDPGLSTIRDYAERTNENSRRLAERGLAGRPFDSVKSVTDLLQLIERQEAAERELIHRGMEWDPVTRRWIDPDTQP